MPAVISLLELASCSTLRSQYSTLHYYAHVFLLSSLKLRARVDGSQSQCPDTILSCLWSPAGKQVGLQTEKANESRVRKIATPTFERL